MKKKILIILSIILILLIIAIIFVYVSVTNVTKIKPIETSQTNIIDNDFINVIESEQVNEVINETVVETAEVESPLNTSNNQSTTTTSDEKVTTQNTTTKNETKSNTTTTTNTSSSNTNTNTNISTSTKSTQETTSENTNNSNTQTTTTTTTARPELAYSTYRETNTAIVPEIIRILNDEISKYDDLVDYGSKVLVGNKASAYEKTSGFTYLFVNDIEKGKVAGNYVTFEQRVRNSVGAFANYNVYAEDEYTYNGQGLNPRWCQTLVWIYLTF